MASCPQISQVAPTGLTPWSRILSSEIDLPIGIIGPARVTGDRKRRHGFLSADRTSSVLVATLRPWKLGDDTSWIVRGVVVIFATREFGRSRLWPIPRTFHGLRSADGAAACLFAFDLLWLNGDDLRALPLEERRARLQKVFRGSDKVLARASRVTARPSSATPARCGWKASISKRRVHLRVADLSKLLAVEDKTAVRPRATYSLPA